MLLQLTSEAGVKWTHWLMNIKAANQATKQYTRSGYPRAAAACMMLLLMLILMLVVHVAGFLVGTKSISGSWPPLPTCMMKHGSFLQHGACFLAGLSFQVEECGCLGQ
jgi:hypothetical protein